MLELLSDFLARIMEHSLKKAFARADEIPHSCFPPLPPFPFSPRRAPLPFRAYSPASFGREFKASSLAAKRKGGRERKRGGIIKDGVGSEQRRDGKRDEHNTGNFGGPGDVEEGGNGRATKHRIKRPKFRVRWIRLTDFTRSLFPRF